MASAKIVAKAGWALLTVGALSACSSGGLSPTASTPTAQPAAPTAGVYQPAPVATQPPAYTPEPTAAYTPPAPAYTPPVQAYAPEPGPAVPAYAAPSAAGVTHVVQRGENVFRLAQRYGVTKEAIAAANGLDAAYSIKAGQTLTIPSADAGALGAPYQSAYAPSPQPDFATATSQPAGRMARPAAGPITRAFSNQTNGVEISGPIGAAVLAADAGTVAYVTQPDSSVGAVVIINHPGDMITAYGRLQNVLVRPGQRVARGAKIAEIGQPAVGDPRLHFELRRGATPIDPTPFL